MFSALRILLVPFLLVGLSACEEETPKTAEVRPVRTVVVDPKPIADDRQAVGEIRPRQESDLGFRVSGKLIVRAVDIGDAASKGAILARLDEHDYRNQLQSAAADVTSAEAVLAEAQINESRQKKLLSSGTTTRATYDVALKNLRSAEAQRESANVALAIAKDQLGYTALSAEFDGIVTAVGAELGQVINVGQMIVRLARQDDKDAVFAVAESDFQDRTLDQGSEVIVTLLSNPAVSADGVVREVSPVADPATRTYLMKVSLRNPPSQMMFGSSVVVRLKAANVAAVVLPGSAIFDKAGKPAVWVFEPATKTVALKPVAVARYETDRAVIAEGLAKGDIVVTAGVNRLREGQEVRLAEEP